MKLECRVPDGKSGPWAVEKFTVIEQAIKLWNLRATIHGDGRYMEPGSYKRLTRNGNLVMSNTPSEIEDLREFFYNASGNVLINGLGLGMAVEGALQKERVTHITVVEIDPDVIKLVGPTFFNPRVSIVQGDAYTWKPPRGSRYDAVWHDIWNDICSANLKQMATLHRKYARRTKWQGSWGRVDCLRAKRRFGE